MDISDITQILIVVEIDGNAHQVLASREYKEIMLTLLAKYTDGLKVSNAIEPIILKAKED